MADPAPPCARGSTGRQPHIVLVGLMGSGKTTVGQALADGLGRPFHDSDADLLTRTGRSARDIAARDGVVALHALELEHLLDAVRATQPAVISAAASVIDTPQGRAALASSDARVAWLRIDPAVAAERVQTGSHRPDNDMEPQAARRDPWFATVAEVVVDVAADDAASIAARLLDWASPGRSTR